VDSKAIEALLRAVASGEVTAEEALVYLRDLPALEVPEAGATLDTHRSLRTGYPEVIFGEGKDDAQLEALVSALVARQAPVLVTRLAPERARALQEQHGGEVHARARCYLRGEAAAPRGRPVLVVSAGASDAAVAEEAAPSARFHGARVETLLDAGVAGVHRVLRHHARLRAAGVVVVVAGMEGALASVVAGLCGRPVLAVPTSVGYGAAFGGLAALLGMLNACAPGVAVLNIDNGFGAGRLAAQIARELRAPEDLPEGEA
jgi:NCAIR mutase (PurE)-related protein